jgi:hypothetical protein
MLGAELIESLEAPGKTAGYCKLYFDSTRDVLLREHAFGFATTRANLPRLAATPVSGFAYAFQKPADCLRLLSVDPVAAGFRVEGDRVLSDSPWLSAVYTRRVDNPAMFDALFVEALAAALAVRLADPITNSSGKKQQALAWFTEAMSRARLSDAVESGCGSGPGPSEAWLSVRGAG